MDTTANQFRLENKTKQHVKLLTNSSRNSIRTVGFEKRARMLRLENQLKNKRISCRIRESVVESENQLKKQGIS